MPVSLTYNEIQPAKSNPEDSFIGTERHIERWKSDHPVASTEAPASTDDPKENPHTLIESWTVSLRLLR